MSEDQTLVSHNMETLFNEAKSVFQAVEGITDPQIAEPFIEQLLTKHLRINIRSRSKGILDLTPEQFEELKTNCLITIQLAYLTVCDKMGATYAAPRFSVAKPPPQPQARNPLLNKQELGEPRFSVAKPPQNPLLNKQELGEPRFPQNPLLNKQEQEQEQGQEQGGYGGAQVPQQEQGGYGGAALGEAFSSQCERVPQVQLSQEEIATIAKQIETQFHRAFWDKLSEDLKDIPPKTDHLLVLLGEVRSRLDRLTPNNQGVLNVNGEHLDLGYLRSQFSRTDSGSTAFLSEMLGGLVHFLVEDRFQKMVAPVYDEELKEWWMETQSLMKSEKPLYEIVPEVFKGVYRWLEIIENSIQEFYKNHI